MMHILLSYRRHTSFTILRLLLKGKLFIATCKPNRVCKHLGEAYLKLSLYLWWHNTTNKTLNLLFLISGRETNTKVKIIYTWSHKATLFGNLMFISGLSEICEIQDSMILIDLKFFTHKADPQWVSKSIPQESRGRVAQFRVNRVAKKCAKIF